MPATQKPSGPLTGPRLLSPAQVAEQLGVHLDTVYRYIARGDFDKAGGVVRLPSKSRPTVRIPQDVLDRFIAAATSVAS